MSTNKMIKPGGLLFAAALAVGLSTTAQAAVVAIGTAADTNVTNTATVDYDVNSVAQTQITSNTDDFEVDRLIDVSVAEDAGSETDVTPGQTTFTETIRFAITNQGNDTQDILLVASNQADTTNDPFGLTGTDSWNAVTNFSYYLDDGDSVFDPGGTDVALPAGGGGAYLADMLSGESRVVWVQPTKIPDKDEVAPLTDGDPDKDMTNGALAVVALVATVRVGGTAGLGAALSNDIASADIQVGLNSVQNVFGDPDGPYDGPPGIISTAAADADAAASDDSAFQVATATISLSKSSAVTSDPVNLTVNPKRIPGATIRYTVIVENDSLASAAATGVEINDDVDTAYLDDTAIELFFDADDDGTCEASEEGDPSITYAGNTVTINVDTAEAAATAGADGNGELDAGESLKFCFDVQIK